MRAVRKLLPHPTNPALALVPLTRGYFAVISVCDSEEVGRFNWHATSELTPVRYAARNVYRGRGQNAGRQYLHQFIADLAGVDARDEIDHINRDGLDCRRSNLRPATRGQNECNKSVRRDNASGLKNVHLDKRDSTWFSTIQVNGKAHYLGRFTTKEEAAAVAAAARERLHGEFARH